MRSLQVSIIMACAVAAFASPIEDGRWIPQKFGDTGRYNRPPNEGKYVHIPNPYIHMHNPYLHIDNPYKWVEPKDVYRMVLQSPDELNPYYQEGYYKNNGIKIIRQKHNYMEDKYDFDFETENKIRAEEKAVLKNANTPQEGIASSGFYEYIGPDGYKYRVDYTADENGFIPRMKRLETQYSGKWVLEKVERTTKAATTAADIQGTTEVDVQPTIITDIQPTIFTDIQPTYSADMQPTNAADLEPAFD